MTRLQLRVITGSVRARPGLFTAALLLSGVLALFGALLLSGRATFLATVEAGARAEFGGYRYQVSGDSDELSERMRALADEGQAVAVLRISAALSGPQAVSDAQVSVLSGPSRTGVLAQGAYPRADGEASISAEVARRTGLSVGDRLELTSEDLPEGTAEYTVTGITRNPAAPNELTAVAVSSEVMGDDAGAAISSWLSDADPCEQIGVGKQCGSGAVTVAGADYAVRSAVQEVNSRQLAGFPVLLALLLLSAGTACGAALAADRPHAGRVAEALRAAGATPRRAAVLAGAGMPLTLLVGSALGIIAAQVALGLGHAAIGSALGQYWDGYRPALLQSGGLILAWLLLAVAVGALPDRLRRWSTETRRAAWHLRPAYGVALGAVGVIVAVVLVYLRVAEPHRVLTGHILGVIVGALAAPVLLLSLPWLRRTPTAGAAVRHCLTVALPVLMATMMFTGFAAFYSASLHFANGTDGREDQTLTVERLTAQDVAVLTTTYPQAMESALVFTELREDQRRPRVAPAGKSDCTDAMCFTALGLIALAPEDGPASALAGTAATELLGGGVEDRATRVFFTLATDQVEETAEVTGLSPSPLLDNQWLPDAVLAADDPQVEALGLEPSNVRTIYLPEFGSLPDDQRDAFRSDVITRAGYAFVIEPDSPEQRQLMRQALALPIAASLVAVIGQGLAAITFLGRLRPVRQQARDYGVGRRGQCALAAPLSLSVVACTTMAALLGRFGAQPALIMNNPLVTGSFGWWWAMPIAASVLVAVGLLVAAARTPRSQGGE
ncbi:hypothetical protein [Actinomyces ruminicola]|uniref:hypothetical protein n=1 Tax=Actinomyces ruminicola TaxID=332524 RepID=UPI0011C8E6BE|nr:hypothetical protein [Actinomyces ruminicola]